MAKSVAEHRPTSVKVSGRHRETQGFGEVSCYLWLSSCMSVFARHKAR